jgi:Bacterial Ig domain
VCVKDAAARNAAGALAPAFFSGTVVDEVTIPISIFDPAAGTLTVTATSSDTTVPPSLTLEGFNLPLAGGQAVVSGLFAPPAKVRVLSSARGFADANVTTGAARPPVTPPAPVLAVFNDSFTINEDSGPAVLNILVNDTATAGGTVTLTSQPRLGIAFVNADGSVTYTPNLNANGSDGFTYTVTVGTTVSNVANVAINILPVNDPPVAVDDGTISVTTGVTTALPSLIANDTDVDGQADIVAAVLETPPGPGATVTISGGIATFTAAADGLYTFTYKAVDASGAISANAATVTVNAIGSDVVVISSALFRIDRQKRWKVTGTGTAPGATIHITYDNGGPGIAGLEIGTAVVDALGNWTLDTTGNTGLLDPTTIPVAQRPTRVRATSSLNGSATIAFTLK